jgi:hypothetical protein
MPIPSELFDLVKSGGAALGPVFIFLWWMERDERKAAQAELRTVSEKVITAMVETKAALGTFGSILNPSNRGQ